MTLNISAIFILKYNLIDLKKSFYDSYNLLLKKFYFEMSELHVKTSIKLLNVKLCFKRELHICVETQIVKFQSLII